MMLQNACIRNDKTLKQKASTTSRAVYQHEVDDDYSIHHEEDDYLDDNFAPDDIYNVHNTNFKRTPHVKSLIPRSPLGIQNPIKVIHPKPRYNGPVDLPKHIYNMVSQDIKKELEKYNQDRKAQFKPTHSRMAKVHEQGHEEVDDSPEHPELTWKTTSMKNPILCKILILRISWRPCKYGIHILYFQTFCFLLWV